MKFNSSILDKPVCDENGIPYGKEYLKHETEENTYCLLVRYNRGCILANFEDPVKELPTDGKVVGTYRVCIDSGYNYEDNFIYDECFVTLNDG